MATSPLSSEQFNAITATAVKAGAVIMDIYSRPIDVELKDDRSPVTAADKAAEAVILKALKEIAPDIPVISEEAASDGYIPHVENVFFLVDPLDGTREFISRNGEFTVNIALIKDTEPLAGVVYAPAKQQLYRGQRGIGASLAHIAHDGNTAAAVWENINVVDAAAGARIAVASRSHADEKTQSYLDEAGVSETIQAGSSLKFCLVARGDAQLYPRMGRTMEWDTAAGQAVLEAAGGSVITEEGSPLGYNKAERGYDNPHFIARAWI